MMNIVALARGSANASHVVSIILVVAIVICFVVGCLQLLNAVKTRAPWWAWWLVALALFIVWELL